MPYLQVELNALEDMERVSRMTRMSAGDVCLGLLTLWRLCWRRKEAVVDLQVLSGCFPGDPQAIAEALRCCGFVELEAGGKLRVKGAEKRLGILRARQQAGRVASGNLKQFTGKPPGEPPGDPVSNPEETRDSAPGLTASSQQPSSSSSKKKEEASSSETHPLPTERAPPLPPRPAESERFLDGDHFFAWVQNERAEAGYVAEKYPHPRKLADFFSSFMMAMGGDEDRAETTVKAWIRSDYWKARNYPFDSFMAKWRDFAPRKVVAL